jgi:hypothetical protein
MSKKTVDADERGMDQFPPFPSDEACPKCRCDQMMSEYATYNRAQAVLGELICWECPDCGYETATRCADAEVQ